MGHFIIQLPDHSDWDVRFGHVFKKTAFDFFRKKKAENARKGYIIVNRSNQKQYRFLKTSRGSWTDKDEAGFEAGNDETGILIKREINEFERGGVL